VVNHPDAFAQLAEQLNIDTRSVHWARTREFAEQVVKQCVGIADNYVRDAWLAEENRLLNRTARSKIGLEIQRHFGLEQ
jgi:hypothetical protein